jgi:hypothetical protein
MGILSRVLVPKSVKKVRRAAHPVSAAKFSAKKAIVPRGVHRALNPGDALEADVARAIRGGSTRRRSTKNRSSGTRSSGSSARRYTVTYNLPGSDTRRRKSFATQAAAQAFVNELKKANEDFQAQVADLKQQAEALSAELDHRSSSSP